MSSRNRKLLERFCRLPKDFRWNELVRLLEWLGYRLVKGGKTAGSVRRFVHDEFHRITVHQPHPSNIVKPAVIRDIMKQLKERGQI